MKRILSNYLFWTYKRGSVEYDVMVTLILLFVFLSPLGINYRDQPVERTLPPSQVLVKSDGHHGLMFQIDAKSLAPFKSDGELEQEFQTVVAPISGEVVIDRFQPITDPDSKKIIAYHVWAHRE